MPWNGSGVFARVYSWAADRDAGLDILADRMDTDTDDIAQGLMHCLTVNGETVPTANLPMANFRHTGASAGVADTDYATVGQIKNGGGGLGSGFVPLTGNSTITGNLSVGGTLTAAQVTSTGNINASGTVTAGLLGSLSDCDVDRNCNVTGNISCGATVSGASLYASGAIAGASLNVGAGTITCGNINSSGTVSAGALYSGTTLSVAGACSINGGVNLNGGCAIIGSTTFGGGNIWPTANNAQECGVAGAAWSACVAYNFVNESDVRGKTDIAPLPSGSLDLVRRIMPQTYRFRDVPADRDRLHWGFVAQEVGEVMTAAGFDFGGHVVDPATGIEGLAYHELVAVLWAAVQELAAR